MSVNVVSTSIPTSQASNVCKNQTSTAQTQTLGNSSLVTTSNTQIPTCTSQNISTNTSNVFMGSLVQTQSAVSSIYNEDC